MTPANADRVNRLLLEARTILTIEAADMLLLHKDKAYRSVAEIRDSIAECAGAFEDYLVQEYPRVS